MTYQHQEFPAARYGPNGAVVIVNSEDETPKGFSAKRNKNPAAEGVKTAVPPASLAASPPASPPKADKTDLDADGHAYDPKLHAATQSKTKDGKWRMKVGVKRPDPAPGYPLPLDL